MSDWQHTVIHSGSHLLEATMEQRWILLRCTPTCANAGPFRVWSSEGDRYFCSVCHDEMRWERE